MRVLAEFACNDAALQDTAHMRGYQQGNCINWQRTFFLRDAYDGKVLIVSLNIFERIVWIFQEVCCCSSYFRDHTVICLSDLETVVNPPDLTAKKADLQAKGSTNRSQSKEESSSHDSKPIPPDPSSTFLPLPSPSSHLNIQPKHPTKAAPSTDQNTTPSPLAFLSQLDEYLQINNLEEALKAIEQSPQEQQISSCRIFAKHRFPQNLELIIDLVDRCHDIPKIKLLIYHEFVSCCIENQLLEQAVRINYKLSNYTKEWQARYHHNFLTIATCYVRQNNVIQAIKTLDSVNQRQLIIPFYTEAASFCCGQARYEDALKLIDQLDFLNKKNELIEEIFLKVADEHYQKGDLEKALEVASHLRLHTPTFLDFHTKVIQAYIDQGELDKAKTTLISDKMRFLGIKTKNDLLIMIIEEYYDIGNLESAAALLIFINDNYKFVKYFYIKIAENYKIQANDDKALDVLRMIINHGCLVNPSESRQAEEYLHQSDFNNALRVIRDSAVRQKEGIW